MNDAGDESKVVGAARVLTILKELAGHAEGVGLDELARAVGSPKSTVHRALQTLRHSGFATLDSPGHYILGDEFLRLAFEHQMARPDTARLTPAMHALATRFGETIHYAGLDGGEVVYRAKVDPPTGGVRLTSVVGGRNPAHATAVGKLLLAHTLPEAEAVARWARQHPMVRRTAHTLTNHEALFRELEIIRSQGYAVDAEENEPGITCVAVPVYLSGGTEPDGAMSVSSLAYRTPLHRLIAALPEIRTILGPLTHE